MGTDHLSVFTKAPYCRCWRRSSATNDDDLGSRAAPSASFRFQKLLGENHVAPLDRAAADACGDGALPTGAPVLGVRPPKLGPAATARATIKPRTSVLPLRPMVDILPPRAVGRGVRGAAEAV